MFSLEVKTLIQFTDPSISMFLYCDLVCWESDFTANVSEILVKFYVFIKAKALNKTKTLININVTDCYKKKV